MDFLDYPDVSMETRGAMVCTYIVIMYNAILK